MTCSGCGTQSKPGHRFCAGCGRLLDAACPACGFLGDPADRFCGACGGALQVVEPVEGAARPTSPAPSSARPVSERRLVSVLFVDLVGFTTLAEARDPEEVREHARALLRPGARRDRRYGGTVEKFIGDAVMAVWGAPVAQEDDAERAVRAGAGTRRRGPLARARASARAGVMTGEARRDVGATGQGMVAGDLVNTATRLQAAAPPAPCSSARRRTRAASRRSPSRRPASSSSRARPRPSRPGVRSRVMAELRRPQPARGARGALRRARRRAAPAQGAVPRDRPRAAPRLVSVIGPGRDRQEPPRLGAPRSTSTASSRTSGGTWAAVRRTATGSRSGPSARWSASEPGSLETDDEATTRARIARWSRE